MQKREPAPWTYISCNLPLKQHTTSEPSTLSLRPSIALTHPQRQDVDPNVNIVIDTEKSLQYSEELGWNWHKSWNIPAVSIRFDITDPDTKEPLICPTEFKAQMYAVKPQLGSDNKVVLVDVGLHGTSKVDIIDGKATLQGLKFSSTSFNNEGLRFHLVICIYLQITETTAPKILKSLMSPAIFVDSRKGVRDVEKPAILDHKLLQYTEMFYPDSFTKRFVRKDPKRKDSQDEEIHNSIESLYAYQTASNIRNKIKHPIFLSVRFSECASLYCNPLKLSDSDVRIMEFSINANKNNLKIDNYVEVMQKLMQKELTEEISPSESNNPYFILLLQMDGLEDRMKRKKLLEVLTPVKSKSLTIILHEAELPDHFVQLKDLVNLAFASDINLTQRHMRDLYSKAYTKLQATNQEILKEEEIDDEDTSSDKIPPPEPQIVHCLPQQSFFTNPQWRNYLELSDTNLNSTKKIKNEPANFSPLNALDFNKLQSPSIISKDDVNHEHSDLKIKPAPTIRADEKTNRNLHQFPFNSFQSQSHNFNLSAINPMNPSQYTNLLVNPRNMQSSQPHFPGLLVSGNNPNLYVINQQQQQNYTRQIGQGLENYYGIQANQKQMEDMGNFNRGSLTWEQQQQYLYQQQYGVPLGQLESPVVVKREGTITKKEEDMSQK